MHMLINEMFYIEDIDGLLLNYEFLRVRIRIDEPILSILVL